MTKFSLSVRLTSSIRTLSVKEVERGMHPACLTQTDGWQMLQAHFPTFQVTQEDGWAGLRDLSGNIIQESLLSLRENLLLGQPQSQTNVLVSLTQTTSGGGNSLLVSAVERLSDHLGVTAQQATHTWVNACCQQALKPLFTAEADYGLVLLTHQQNILVQMLGDLPVGFVYRDCQDSAFTPRVTERLGTTNETQAENIFARERLLRYFPYYLLVNSTFAVIAVLGVAGLDSEMNLMARIRTLLAEARDQMTRKTCLSYVLGSLYWNVKDNFFCYLNDHNENTIIDPSVIYLDFVNPLQAQGVRMSRANTAHSEYGLRCEKFDRSLNLGWGLDNNMVLHWPGELPTGWLYDTLDQIFIAAPQLSAVVLPWSGWHEELQALTLFG